MKIQNMGTRILFDIGSFLSGHGSENECPWLLLRYEQDDKGPAKEDEHKEYELFHQSGLHDLNLLYFSPSEKGRVTASAA